MIYWNSIKSCDSLVPHVRTKDDLASVVFQQTNKSVISLSLQNQCSIFSRVKDHFHHNICSTNRFLT